MDDAADGLAAVEVAGAPQLVAGFSDGHPHATTRRAGGDQAPRRPGGRWTIDVIVVTTFDLDEYVFGALRAGAAGFLLKDALLPDTLIAAIRAGASPATASSLRWSRDG